MVKKANLFWLLLCSFVLVASSFVSAAAYEAGTSNTAGANIAQCSAGNLSAWDWPNQIKTLPHASGSQGADPQFDPNSSSYIIYLTQTNFTSNNLSNSYGSYQYSIFFADSPAVLKLYTINNQTWVSSKMPTGINAAFSRYNLLDSYKVSDSTYFPIVSPQGVTLGNTSVSESDPTYAMFRLDAASIACVAAMHSVVYDASYTGPKYKASQAYTVGVGSAQQCANTDLICKMSNAFQTVAQNVADGIKEAFQWFVNIFLPDMDAISAKFSDLGTLFTNKLGFLAWPFVFLTNAFNALTNGDSWCTQQNCTLGGSVMGGAYMYIDLLALAHNGYAPLWNLALLFIRGSTLVLLAFFFYRKFSEVTK